MQYAYVGSFDYNGNGGVHICSYDAESGRFTPLQSLCPEINAGFAGIEDGMLYLTDERAGDPQKNPHAGGGRICTFRVDRVTGKLQMVQRIPTFGVNPSHLTLDQTGRYAIVTHFSIGPMITRTVRTQDGGFRAEVQGSDSTTCLFRREADGTLGRMCDVYWHRDGQGPMSMIHKAARCPNRNLYAETDLGADLIYLFSLDYEKEKMVCHGSFSSGTPGAGPRHSVFHPTLPLLYVNYERSGSLSWFRVTEENKLCPLGTLALVPSDTELGHRDNQSELMFHPNGRILYSFLRGKGYALVLRVDEDGTPSLVQRFKLHGNDPRGAALSPDGRYLLIAGHEADELETVKVRPDGALEATGICCQIPHPACIAFL